MHIASVALLASKRSASLAERVAAASARSEITDSEIIMGWKNVKEHYRIGHFVQVSPKGICIGSPYIHDLIVVGVNGELLKRYEERGNDELARYQREMLDDPQTLRDLISKADCFETSIPVYTYDGGDVVEKLCEKAGWPNVTHDGLLMYENTFSTDRDTAVVWAKRNARAGISMTKRRIIDVERELAELRASLRSMDADLSKLNVDYPEIGEEVQA